MLTAVLLLTVSGCGGVVTYGTQTGPADQIDITTKAAINRASSLESNGDCPIDILDRKVVENHENGNTRQILSIKRCERPEKWEATYIKREDGTIMVAAKKI